MISGDITVARLLEEHPGLLEVLAAFHPHFKQLRNKLLRRVMAPRVTVAQAARMAGVRAEDLLAALRRAAGEAAPQPFPHPALPSGDRGISGSPEGRGNMPDIPRPRQVHLDVREDIRRGQEPFARIMATVKALGPDQALVLRVPFEPIPLYDVLGKRGFAHWTENRAPDDWSVWCYRANASAEGIAAAPAAPSAASAPPGERITLDVRGLEPPQPMVRVLEAVERLEPGQTIEVLHERRPMFLYPQLDDRGFAHETDEPAPGLVRIVIRRGGSG